MPTTPSRASGRLDLNFEYSDVSGTTVLRQAYQEPPLRVIRAFSLPEGASLVHLHNTSGGILGGDQLNLTVKVGAKAAVQLTTTGATRIYRSRGATAHQTNHFSIGRDAILEYLPDPLIPFGGSRYSQQTTLELAEGAGLFWWEVIAPGREASGEWFDYSLLELKLDLLANGQPLAVERVRLEPDKRPLNAVLRLGNYRYFATFYICRVGLAASQWLALEAELNQLAAALSQPEAIVWGVSTLTAHGLVVRALSRHNRTISSGLLEFWRIAKHRLYGQAVSLPRKVY